MVIIIVGLYGIFKTAEVAVLIIVNMFKSLIYKPKPNRKTRDVNLTEVYKFLEIARAAGEFGFNVNKPILKNDLKSRFRNRVKEVHPDHGGNVEDFIRVKRSYDLLINHAIVF